jgi:hypothetical protein
VTRTKTSKTSQFAVIKRSTGIGSHTSEFYYRLYKIATSCVNRCASCICNNRLSREKLQEIFLHMISTVFSSFATHNIRLIGPGGRTVVYQQGEDSTCHGLVFCTVHKAWSVLVQGMVPHDHIENQCISWTLFLTHSLGIKQKSCGNHEAARSHHFMLHRLA